MYANCTTTSLAMAVCGVLEKSHLHIIWLKSAYTLVKDGSIISVGCTNCFICIIIHVQFGGRNQLILCRNKLHCQYGSQIRWLWQCLNFSFNIFLVSGPTKNLSSMSIIDVQLRSRDNTSSPYASMRCTRFLFHC